MATAYIRLSQVPPEFIRAREQAPRDDGLHLLPESYTRLGFAGDAAQGTIVSIDEANLRTGSILAPVALPVGCERVYRATVAQLYGGKFSNELTGAAIGSDVYLSSAAFNYLKSINVVVPA